MAESELGRLNSIGRTAKLIAALLSGRDLTRAEITALLEERVAAADRQIAAIGRHVPLIREKRRGRLHVRIDRSKVAGGAERTPIATIIAACVGASLSKLFEGTSYEKGMRDLVHYVSRDAIHPERFQDSRRQFVFLVRGGEKALPEKEELLEEVVDAVQRRRGLQIRYRAFDGARQSLRIEPLSLAVYDHQLYLIGRSRGRPAHPYRFSRLEAAEAAGGTFQYPDKDSYDPERVAVFLVDVVTEGRQRPFVEIAARAGVAAAQADVLDHGAGLRRAGLPCNCAPATTTARPPPGCSIAPAPGPCVASRREVAAPAARPSAATGPPWSAPPR